MSETVLSLRGLHKSFGGIHAVDNVSFDVKAGERRVLIGPNGAGKTSLFHCISGTHTPTTGSIFFCGEPITHMPEHERTLLGIGRTFQISSVCLELSALENVLLAVLGVRAQKWDFWNPFQTDAGLRRRAEEKLVMVGLAAKFDRQVSDLSYGERRQLELALALSNDPQLLLLDEPCAGLSPAERQRFFSLVKNVPRSVTVLMIEHDMDVALGLADRVTVLHRGQVILDGTADEVRVDEKVREVYFGRV